MGKRVFFVRAWLQPCHHCYKISPALAAAGRVPYPLRRLQRVGSSSTKTKSRASKPGLKPYGVFSPLGGGCGTTAGLYSGAGRAAGLFGSLISFFFGFFFSRPRVSRLPMTLSSQR